MSCGCCSPGVAIPYGGLVALTENLNLFVSNTGDDCNCGLSSSTAFATIQRAVDVVRTRYVLCGFSAIINVADGTYIENVMAESIVGGNIRFVGSTNAIWQGNSGRALTTSIGTYALISGFTLGGGSSTQTIIAFDSSRLSLLGGHVFAAASSQQICAARGAGIILSGNYTISGGGSCHIGAYDGGVVDYTAITVTLTGSPAFSTAFAQVARVGVLGAASVTFSGAATGKRYDLLTNGVIWTIGRGAMLFPGSVAGTITSGGSYT